MSKRFHLCKTDWISIGKGLLVAGAGAGIVEILTRMKDLDWNEWTPVMTAASAVLVNIVRKWVADETPKRPY